MKTVMDLGKILAGEPVGTHMVSNGSVWVKLGSGPRCWMRLRPRPRGSTVINYYLGAYSNLDLASALDSEGPYTTWWLY